MGVIAFSENLIYSQTRRHMMKRGYLLLLGEYRLYIASSVLKTTEFSRVRSTCENSDVFNSRDEIYSMFTEKSKFSCSFILFILLGLM